MSQETSLATELFLILIHGELCTSVMLQGELVRRDATGERGDCCEEEKVQGDIACSTASCLGENDDHLSSPVRFFLITRSCFLCTWGRRVCVC